LPAGFSAWLGKIFLRGSRRNDFPVLESPTMKRTGFVLRGPSMPARMKAPKASFV
jgi:hypothetical protein